MILRYPVNYIAITQYFGSGHGGMDLGWASAHGGPEQPVYAAGDGIVVSCRNDYSTNDPSGSSYGNYVEIKHDDSMTTLCAHLKYGSVTVSPGQRVKQGDLIGRMGNTGRADGNHVHYELFINNVKSNPEPHTYVFPGQVVSSDPSQTIGLLKEPTPEPEPDPCDKEKYEKEIKELQDKIILQAKEIDALKEELDEQKDIVFTYNVKKTSLYELKMYEGETLLIKGIKTTE